MKWIHNEIFFPVFSIFVKNLPTFKSNNNTYIKEIMKTYIITLNCNNHNAMYDEFIIKQIKMFTYWNVNFCNTSTLNEKNQNNT